MSFGQVKSILVSHQQEFADRLAAHDKHAAGFDLPHFFGHLWLHRKLPLINLQVPPTTTSWQFSVVASISNCTVALPFCNSINSSKLITPHSQ
jgi:hypothetical protein